VASWRTVTMPVLARADTQISWAAAYLVGRCLARFCSISCQNRVKSAAFRAKAG